MGHSYAYRCKHCGYEQDFNQGHGFLVHSQTVKEYLAQRTKLLHYKTHSLLNKLEKKYSDLYLKSGFQVYKCTKCDLLYDKVEVTVFKDNKMLHKSEFRCRECRSRLKLTNIHRLKRAKCPNCRKRSFYLDPLRHSLWD